MLNQEQQHYVEMLKEIISDTNNNKIQSADQLIHVLIDKLGKTGVNHKTNIIP